MGRFFRRGKISLKYTRVTPIKFFHTAARIYLFGCKPRKPFYNDLRSKKDGKAAVALNIKRRVR